MTMAPLTCTLSELQQAEATGRRIRPSAHGCGRFVADCGGVAVLTMVAHRMMPNCGISMHWSTSWIRFTGMPFFSSPKTEPGLDIKLVQGVSKLGGDTERT